MLTLDSLYQAVFALKGVARQTDLIRAPRMFPDNEVYLKTENLQLTGSFKLRGAYNKIHRLSAEEKARGVVACSAGNHSQGVALAAQRAGIDAVICIPEGAPISKVEATRGYGAQVELVPGVYDDAYERALAIAAETGRTMIHPFDDDDVIAGQGTIALEILDALPDMDICLVPVGGGGLISGMAFAIKSLRPSCRVVGVQAAGAASMKKALSSHKRLTLERVATIADGIAVKTPGEKTFDYCSKYVDEVVTVSEDEIASAILSLMEQQKLVAEGAGAVSVAAAMSGKVDLAGKKTVCLVSGGNIDVTILSRVITRGLMMQGRQVELEIEVYDRPKQLALVSALVAQLGANVVSVEHDRKTDSTDLQHCMLRLGLETRNQDHIDQIVAAIRNDLGYRCVEL
ncbi:MAG: threonine ammonia-lyase [Spirochaetes bacterium]|uniref:Threonine ammonia-lyase n=1 Tax=Candidatus Aphodenecus pullistercoris TaxID=2840669 RepID=A0A9D9E9D9_9SPIR|nr:threonine ammonia-lyase [Candidatus Aphodenecus pullistercoris]